MTELANEAFAERVTRRLAQLKGYDVTRRRQRGGADSLAGELVLLDPVTGENHIVVHSWNDLARVVIRMPSALAPPNDRRSGYQNRRNTADLVTDAAHARGYVVVRANAANQRIGFADPRTSPPKVIAAAPFWPEALRVVLELPPLTASPLAVETETAPRPLLPAQKVEDSCRFCLGAGCGECCSDQVLDYLERDQAGRPVQSR